MPDLSDNSAVNPPSPAVTDAGRAASGSGEVADGPANGVSDYGTDAGTPDGRAGALRIQATSVSISTSAPRELAAFYARLLDVPVTVSEGPGAGQPPEAGWAQLRPVEGRLAMTLNFEWDEHYTPPVWPTPAPSRLGWPSVDRSPGPHPPAAGPAPAHPEPASAHGESAFAHGESAEPVPNQTPTAVPTAELAVRPEPGAQQVMAHLDLWVDDLDEATTWARACGATEHPHQPQEGVRVMLDPHGHPFCLFVG